MKALVVYGSQYGNTRKIAEAIGSGISGDAKVAEFKAVKPEDIQGLDLLVVGAPTQAGQIYPDMKPWFDALKKDTLKGIKVAAFDTRITIKLVKLLGFAAGRIGKKLKKLGGNPVAEPVGFEVTKDDPPAVAEGELERAAAWGQKLTIS